MLYTINFLTVSVSPTKEPAQLTTTLWLGFFLLLLVVILTFIGFYFLFKKSQSKNNTILLTSLQATNTTTMTNLVRAVTKNPQWQPKNATPTREVPEKIANHIKKQLHKFEKKKEFLNPDLKLAHLAELFETNTKYLAKVIVKEKGKPFKTYIKDLKVAFAKSRIDNEYKLRRYKMEVIANECGFKTAESFSRHFFKTYDIYPSKYIKKVETEFRKNW